MIMLAWQSLEKSPDHFADSKKYPDIILEGGKQILLFYSGKKVRQGDKYVVGTKKIINFCTKTPNLMGDAVLGVLFCSIDLLFLQS